MLINDIKSKILLGSKIGLEYEFFSNFKNDKTATLLSRVLNKKISVEDKAHSDFVPTKLHYKLEPDMSGGKKTVELVTAAIPYQDARIEMIKVLKWIQENGTTDDKCGIHINISFDDDKFGTTFLSHMNVLKFILDFDEDVVYKYFPKREGNVYAKSIKFIVPKSKFYFSDVKNVNVYDFIYPTEKYYGVNFDKLVSNYLEFRYLGGANYEEQISDLLNVTDFFILQLHNSAIDKDFTTDNHKDLTKILKRSQHLIKSYSSYEQFKKFYPDVGFLVDLDTDIRRLDSYWPVIRDKLFSLLNECSLKDGYINYDSDTGKIQLKDANLMKSFKIEGIELFNCKLRGVLRNCDLFNCTVEDGEISDCNIFNECDVKNSKIKASYVNQTSVLRNCYVYGKKGLMNGHMIGGIFREGRMTSLSRFDDVEKIDWEKIKNNYYVKY